MKRPFTRRGLVPRTALAIAVVVSPFVVQDVRAAWPPQPGADMTDPSNWPNDPGYAWNDDSDGQWNYYSFMVPNDVLAHIREVDQMKHRGLGVCRLGPSQAALQRSRDAVLPRR